MARFVRVQSSSKDPSGVRASFRRDPAGHLNRRHEHRLLSMAREGRSPDEIDGTAHAFIVGRKTRETLGEELGEAFLESATTGEPCEMDRFDQVTEDEDGGPFVFTSAAEEFADGYDESNTLDATREPFPKTSNSPTELEFQTELSTEPLGPLTRTR